MQKEKEQTELLRAPEPCGTGNGQSPQDPSGAERQPEALAVQARRWSHRRNAAVSSWGCQGLRHRAQALTRCLS